jgi:hypothetical protein
MHEINGTESHKTVQEMMQGVFFQNLLQMGDQDKSSCLFLLKS